MTTFFTAKHFSHALVIFASISFTACGGSSNGGNTPSNGNSGEPTPVPSIVPTATTTPVPTVYPSSKPTPAPQPNTPPPELPENGFGINGYTPSADSENRALVADITVSFSKRLIEATVVPDNVSLTMEDQDVEFDLQFDGDAALTLIPKSRFTPNATYTIELRNNLMSEEGDTLETIRWKFTTAPNLGATPQDVIDSCMTKVDIDMLAAVNEARAKGHSCISGDFPPAEPLKWSCALGAAAYRHSADMATNNFLQHTGSDGSSHSDRLERAGYKAVRSAENIAGGFQDVKRVVADWLQSDMGHCENIMNPLYEDFGAALVTASPTMVKFGRYWTQSFGQHEAPEEDEPEAQP